MKIVMLGTGYVGLVSGVCFSDFGHDVVCVDTNAAKVAALQAGVSPIYEPGLDDLIAKNSAAKRLSFTTDLSSAVEGADAIFIAVGTPARRGDGHADLTYVHQATRDIAEALKAPATIVMKSTVPVGTNAAVREILQEMRPDLALDVVSNPEFLREGAAIEDFMRPDRVVVGLQGERAREVMRAIYRPLSLREVRIVYMSPESAELTKYAANAFLATKITFINEVADLCERVGGNIQDVANGIGMDGRIGPKFLHAGPGYGGSCFPKDTSALAQIGRTNNSPLRIVETVIDVNDARKRRMVDKVLLAFDQRIAGRRIAIFGVTFKPETDDMRDAPALTIVPALVGAGAVVHVCDPLGRKEGEALLPGVTWFDDAYEAARDADAVVLLTEWNMFRGIDLGRLHDAMAGDLLLDMRNVYEPAEAAAAKFRYEGIGRSARSLDE
jgi:UDPglucose 6-dehydrogenase